MNRRIVMALLVLLLAPAFALAQELSPEWSAPHLTRAELQEMLERYEAVASSEEYYGPVRERARLESAQIRQRLEQGDIQQGDRILLRVENHPELSDTFTVSAGRKLLLPAIGEIPMEGVLHSELQDYMAVQIGRFIRAPTVYARPLIRLEVLGAVRNPGFYAVPSDVLVSDVVMVAGGPTGNARVDRVRINRGQQVLWDGERLRAAVLDGRTLEQLSVRPGDGVFVPERRSTLQTFRDASMIVGGVLSITYLYYRISDRR
jgi:protein involved in polysaccharide export with SLBB domain